jgi:hypothetical protein
MLRGAAAATLAGGIVPAIDEFRQKKCRHRAERVRSYPMSEAARARILAEVAAICRRERAVRAARGEGEDGG